MRVLIIDDEEDVRGGLSRLLEAEGHDILCAESAEKAVAILREEREAVDVAVVDMVMDDDPESGLKVIGFIAAEKLLVATVVLTGKGSEAICVKSFEAGALQYIEKGTPDQVLRLRLAVRGAALTIHQRRESFRREREAEQQASTLRHLRKELRRFAGELKRIIDNLPPEDSHG